MKVTKLWVYPIKAIRGISLEQADLTFQGIRHDRSFMLCTVSETGELQKLQLSKYPQCALFSQAFSSKDNEPPQQQLIVRYHGPAEPIVPIDARQDEELVVPLEPDVSHLELADVNLHQACTKAYRMGEPYDGWFSACFGFPTVFLYIGSHRRPILGTFSPKSQIQQPTAGIASRLMSYVLSDKPEQSKEEEEDWLTFTDCAPFLIASESSLAAFKASLPPPSAEGADAQRSTSQAAEMYKFRPNVVVTGTEPWQEDFWTTLTLRGKPGFTLSKMCNRCMSLNVDYDTGKFGQGESGEVLKRLSKDRRVDEGMKYAPVFGRYAFLADGAEGKISLGDEIDVAGLAEERPVWDWPLKDPSAQKWYGQQLQAQKA